MSKIVFDPVIVNASIKRIYCDKFDIIQYLNHNLVELCFYNDPYEHCVPVVPCNDVKTFFLIKIDDKKSCTFYHANLDWLTDDNLVKCLLDEIDFSDCQFISAYGIIPNNELEIIHYVYPNDKNRANFYSYYYLDLDNNNIYQKTKCADTGFYEYQILQKTDYDNLLVACRDGMIYLNSENFTDLIFYTMNQKNDLSKKYNINMNAALFNLKNMIKAIQEKTPKENYAWIHHFFQINDNQYYTKKINHFQSKIISIFKDIHEKDHFDLQRFANLFCRDMIHEIYLIYHRWRCYPSERLEMYHKFPEHPYIKLIKMVHQLYLDTKNHITVDFILSRIQQNKYFVHYDDFIITLIEAASSRSELFVDAYGAYHSTKQSKIIPKYYCKTDYYPFKIFSVGLFLMEHMLS